MIWIVGRMHQDFQRYLELHSIPYGVFSDVKFPNKPVLGPNIPAVALDFSDYNDLLRQLDAHALTNVSGILTAGYENYVVPASIIATHFNVPGPTQAAAIAATDKAVMRQAFLEHTPHLTPDYQVVASWDEVEAFAKSHSFPLMLKPANLMKSLHITKNKDMSQLRKNYQETVAAFGDTYERYSLGMQPKLLIEAFLEGSMHTVAGFVDSEGIVAFVPGITDCRTAADIGVDDSYIYNRQLPSNLAESDQKAIMRAAKQAVAALGVTSTPLHIEIILTTSGPKIIEIGARIGGYRARMYEYAIGIDMYAATIATALDRPLSFHATVSNACCVLELFPTNTGTFKAISNESAINSLPSLHYYSVKPNPGTVVGKASQGYKASAVIILRNKDKAALQHDLSVVTDLVRVELQ